MIYGYARVSTKHQNLELQLESLKKYGCDKIYSEKISGDFRKNNNREQLDKLLSVLQKGDTLVVWKLDRLSRTLLQTINILEQLQKEEINFISITDNFNSTTPYGRMLMYIAAVFAQLEVELTRERTIEGLEAARRRGHIGGRKGISKVVQSTMYQMYYSGDYTINQICDECGISATTLYKYIHQYNDTNTKPELLDFNRPPIKIVKPVSRSSGRPTLDETTIKKLRHMYNSHMYTVDEILKEVHISRSTFYKYKKDDKEVNSSNAKLISKN